MKGFPFEMLGFRYYSASNFGRSKVLAPIVLAKGAARGLQKSLQDNDLTLYGGVAQLGERRVRNAKVEGSIPFSSTII